MKILTFEYVFQHQLIVLGKKNFKIIIWKCQLWWLKICSTVIYADATITTAWFGHIYGQYHKVQYTTYLHIVWCEKKKSAYALISPNSKNIYIYSISFLYDFLVHKTKYSENLKKINQFLFSKFFFAHTLIYIKSS